MKNNTVMFLSWLTNLSAVPGKEGEGKKGHMSIIYETSHPDWSYRRIQRCTCTSRVKLSVLFALRM